MGGGRKRLAGAVLTAPPGRETDTLDSLEPGTLAALEALAPCGFRIVKGGPERSDSVRFGLESLVERARAAGIDPDRAIVHVHDGARPWVTEALVAAAECCARARGSCVPVTPLVDTPKELGTDGFVRSHPGRGGFGGAQTPQTFVLGTLLEAHRRAAGEGWKSTDDASAWDRYIGPVAWIEGERENMKVTYREDLVAGTRAGDMRIGEGWDIHRLAEGRALMLGGLRIPSDKGEFGHSDGDALWHAAIDALLGAIAEGDIGAHFPPSDAKWKDADSSDLAGRIMGLVRERGWELSNLDATVTLEAPRLGPHRDAIRSSMARVLGVDPGAVSVKAKTNEGLDSTGRGEAVQARVVVLLERAGR